MKNGFRLEQVLNLRKEVERQRKLEFADAKRQYEHAVDHLRSEEENVALLNNELHSRQSEGISLAELQMYSHYFQRKHGEIKQQRTQVDCLGEAVTEKRDCLMEASRDKKVLETLKEKKLAELKRQRAEREQAFIDELSAQNGGEKKL